MCRLRPWPRGALPRGAEYRLLHRLEQNWRLVRWHAAALREVGVTAAPAGERALDQVSRGQAEVLRGPVDRHDQRRLAVGPGNHSNHGGTCRIDLAPDLLSKSANLV